MSRTPITALASSALVPPSPTGSYIFSIALTPSHICALTSTQTLHVLSPSTLQTQQSLSSSPTHTLLSTLSPTSLLTSGEDGSIHHYDLRASSLAGKIPVASPVSSLAAHAGAGLVSAGTLQNESTCTGAVYIYDSRNSRAPVRAYKDSHSDDVTALGFSSSAGRVVSGGTDGYVNVFSLSAAAGRGGEGDDEVEGAVVSVTNHGSVHKLGFLGGGEMWAKSHDEVLAIYSQDGEEEGNGRDYKLGDVRKAVEGCEYVVDLLPRGEGDAWVVAGSMAGQWVDLVPLDRCGVWGSGGFRLLGGHGEEVCRDVKVDVATSTIFTGGEDGIVKAWRPPTEDVVAAMEVAEESAPQKKEKTKKKNKKSKDEKKLRHAPY